MAREDLNPVEEARAFAALVEELGLTREEVGRRVGRSRVAISNLLRLLDLPDEALELLESRPAHRGPRPRAADAPTTTPTAAASPAPPPTQGWSVRVTRGDAPATRGGPPSRAAARAAAPRCTPTRRAAAEQIADALGAALGHRRPRAPARRRATASSSPSPSLDEALALARRLGPRAVA